MVNSQTRGGDALVDLLFDNGLPAISDSLRQAAEDGIRTIEHRGDGGEHGPTGRDAGKTWVPDAFAFTREKTYSTTRGDFDYLQNTGVVLKKCAERQGADMSFLESYREDLKNLKGSSSGKGLAELVVEESLKESFARTMNGFKEAFPPHISTLAIFLRWKASFHKQREEIDLTQLADEARAFVSAVEFDSTVAAVWLLGCFAGYERIAPAVYAAGPAAKYRWYSGDKLEIVKVSRPQEDNGPPTPEPSHPAPQWEPAGEPSGEGQGSTARHENGSASETGSVDDPETEADEGKRYVEEQQVDGTAEPGETSPPKGSEAEAGIPSSPVDAEDSASANPPQDDEELKDGDMTTPGRLEPSQLDFWGEQSAGANDSSNDGERKQRT